MSEDTETTEEKCRRELDDLEYLLSCVDARLRRIDAQIAELRQQLKDLNEKEWK